MIKKTCEVCGKEFTIKPYRENTARFCSFQCGGTWHMQNREMPHDHLLGNKFRCGKRPTNAFTSEQVSGSNNPRWSNGIECMCQQCGKTFRVKSWLVRQNGTPKYCSKKCRVVGMSGENSPLYVGGPTTYRGKGWLEVRKQAIARDGGTCQDCGRIIGNSIPVHHINPYRNSKTNDLDNLVCLCQSCHMRQEQAGQ